MCADIPLIKAGYTYSSTSVIVAKSSRHIRCIVGEGGKRVQKNREKKKKNLQ